MDAVPPALGLTSDQVTGVLAAADRAPSLHDSRPWRFRVRSDVIELWSDPGRRLPAADPTGRAQRLACGAALYNLRLALQGCGVRPMVTLCTEPGRPDLVATVRVGGRRAPTPAQLELLAAVSRRHTDEHPYPGEPVTGDERAALRRAAVAESAWLHVVDDGQQRDVVVRLEAEAHEVRRSDPAYRAEVARWSAARPGGSGALTDGHPRQSAAAGLPVERNPTIAVLTGQLLGTSAEVRIGQALQRILLTATTTGLVVSLLPHVIEVDRTREELRRLVRGVHGPQVVLRVGRRAPLPPARSTETDRAAPDVQVLVRPARPDRPGDHTGAPPGAAQAGRAVRAGPRAAGRHRPTARPRV